MPKFEDQLLTDLMRSHGPALDDVPPPTPSSSSRRPLWLTAGGLGIAAVGTLVISSTDGGAPAAYAVTEDSDGTVTLSLADLTGVDDANAELTRRGIRAAAARVQPDCPSIWSFPSAPEISAEPGYYWPERHTVDGRSYSFFANRIPEDATMLLGASDDGQGGIKYVASVIAGPVPDCVSIPE